MTENGDWEIIQGDCLDVLRTHAAGVFDAVVTDPPYELGFMGKRWDASGIACQVDLWREVYRVLKPGGHILAFGGTRTYHRMACAIEDAGFEIRDSLHWVYGSGFPKSHDISKAIDKLAGAEREVIGRNQYAARRPNPMAGTTYQYNAAGYDISANLDVTAPATEAAQHWAGWGTALKPSHEPIVLARKPLAERTVAANVLAHGTGAINVDGCRVIGGNRPLRITENHGLARNAYEGGASRQGGSIAAGDTTQGRWPPNLLLSHAPECNGACAPGCPVAELDGQSGISKSSNHSRHNSGGVLKYQGTNARPSHDTFTTVTSGVTDTGGASRYFPVFRYQAKASRAERNAGLEGMEEKAAGIKNASGRGFSEHSPYADIKMANHHPTVKPIDLMRWLCRLITPPGGLILDPFAGSGTTGCAAVLERFRFVGIEREAEYVTIARARIVHWEAQRSSQLRLFDAV